MLDYEIYSAPINDLSNWTSKGINYSSKLDPLSIKTNRCYMYAPDCVKGNDGKYYLYYCLSGEKGSGGYFGPISVARCDTPDGKYEFYGHVKNEDGTLFNEYVLFDPAVINDSAIIRLYYGTFYPFHKLPKLSRSFMRKLQRGMFNKSIEEIKAKDDKILGPYTIVLSDDMLTVKSKPMMVLDCYNDKNIKSHFHIIPKCSHRMSGNSFFEGSSIRKIGDLYYFVYSSLNNHELCYATSHYPDRDYKYRGVIISNGDVGYNGRSENDRLNHTATNHGCIEYINGNYYVFYHKQTHGSDYSRICCAEKIEIESDGKIKQVQITSQSFSSYPLSDKTTYKAINATYITNGKMPHKGNGKVKSIPMVYSNEKEVFITNLKKGCVVYYRYFDLTNSNYIIVRLKGDGVLALYTSMGEVDRCKVNSEEYKDYVLNINGTNKEELIFKIMKGNIEFLEFDLK